MFVTYLTIYEGDKLPPFYIGSTSAKRISTGYKGSVRSKKFRDIWENEVKNHPDLFDVIVLSEHTTRDEALIEEERLQKKHKVVTSEMFINCGLARGGFVNPGFFTDEQRAKMSRSAKARGVSPTFLAAGQEARTGMKDSEQTKAKRRASTKAGQLARFAAMSKEERLAKCGGLKGKPWPEARRRAYELSKGN